MLRNTAKAILNILPARISTKFRSALYSHRKRRMKAESSMSVRDEFSSSGEILSLLLAFKFYLSPNKKILFYPKCPSKYQVYYKNCMLLGYSITNNPLEPHDIAIHFQPDTHADPEALSLLENNSVVINRSCTDVSKTHVQNTFSRIFGYELAVNPTSYKGPMVEKSDENYRHDGKIITGPIEPSSVQDGCVYQRAVSNEDGQGHIVDFRVPIYDGHIPLVYTKLRPLDNRFGTEVVHAEISEPNDVFSEDERSHVSLFAEKMGVDYAEMDILRDNKDGRIYVVDVNNTPAGPAKGLSPHGKIVAMNRLSRAFEHLIESAMQKNMKQNGITVYGS